MNAACAEGLTFLVLSEPLPLNVATFNAIKKVVKFNARYSQNKLGERNLLDIAAAQAAKLRAGGSITFTIGTCRRSTRSPAPTHACRISRPGTVLHRPLPNGALATSMTGSLDAFTRALALELAPIRVNIVSPGAVQTEVRTSLLCSHRR